MMRFGFLLGAMVLGLSGCGGGGGEPSGGALGVDVSSKEYIDCVDGVNGPVSKHIVSGGQPPYFLSSLSKELVLGTYVNGAFDAVDAGQATMGTEWKINDSNTAFWIQTQLLGCDSSVTVRLRDSNGSSANVTISTTKKAAV